MKNGWMSFDELERNSKQYEHPPCVTARSDEMSGCHLLRASDASSDALRPVRLQFQHPTVITPPRHNTEYLILLFATHALLDGRDRVPRGRNTWNHEFKMGCASWCWHAGMKCFKHPCNQRSSASQTRSRCFTHRFFLLTRP
jgi:hypothetical protein